MVEVHAQLRARLLARRVRRQPSEVRRERRPRPGSRRPRSRSARSSTGSSRARSGSRSPRTGRASSCAPVSPVRSRTSGGARPAAGRRPRSRRAGKEGETSRAAPAPGGRISGAGRGTGRSRRDDGDLDRADRYAGAPGNARAYGSPGSRPGTGSAGRAGAIRSRTDRRRARYKLAAAFRPRRATQGCVMLGPACGIPVAAERSPRCPLAPPPGAPGRVGRDPTPSRIRTATCLANAALRSAAPGGRSRRCAGDRLGRPGQLDGVPHSGPSPTIPATARRRSFALRSRASRRPAAAAPGATAEAGGHGCRRETVPAASGRLDLRSRRRMGGRSSPARARQGQRVPPGCPYPRHPRPGRCGGAARMSRAGAGSAAAAGAAGIAAPGAAGTAAAGWRRDCGAGCRRGSCGAGERTGVVPANSWRGGRNVARPAACRASRAR